MDPITLVIFATLFVLATGGATTAAVRHRRALHAVRLKEALRATRPVQNQRLSLFDLFWDLGASDFALELMAHHDLLPSANDDAIHRAWSNMEDLVRQYGSYDSFLENSLEAIQEFFEEHRHAGHRRRLPGLTGAQRKVVPIPRRLESDRPSTDPNLPSTQVVNRPSVEGMRRRRQMRRDGGPAGLVSSATTEEVDLDTIGRFEPMDILQSVLDGKIGDRIEQWWKLRTLRQLRKELDQSLAELYRFYADTARRNPDFYEPLYDAHQRWRDETTRLRFTARRRPWSNKDYALAADVLFELAVDLAEGFQRRAHATTYQIVETIHAHARKEDTAMAGYLVYLNRHAFFAGRHPEYGDLARDIEFATQRMREEILRLRDQGVV